MKKWVERAAIITGSLGFIGVVVIFFMTMNEHLNNNEKQVLKDNKKPDSSNYIKTDTNYVKTDSLLTDKVDIPKADTIPLPPPEKITKPEPETIRLPTKDKLVTAEPKNVATATPKPATKPKSDKKEVAEKKEKTVQKLLSKEELEDLYTAIHNRRTVSSKMQNCVKLYFLEGANNVQAVKQVEHYLVKRKLVITGRETVEKSRKGVYIKSTGSCITVTIGRL